MAASDIQRETSKWRKGVEDGSVGGQEIRGGFPFLQVNNATLTDDNLLVIPLTANRVYALDYFFSFNRGLSGPGASVKWNWGFTGSVRAVAQGIAVVSTISAYAAGADQNSNTAMADITGLLAIGIGTGWRGQGHVQCIVDGDLKLQWAQVAASLTTVTRSADSYLKVQELFEI